jgi:uncharacterized protein YuzE
MKVTYDAAANAAYVYLSPDGTPDIVARTYACDPLDVQGQINLDFDPAGHLIGIEILGARSKLSPHVLRQADAIGEPVPQETAPT